MNTKGGLQLERKKPLRKKYKIKFNKLGLLLPIILLSLGALLYFSELTSVGLKLLGLIILFSGGISLFILSLSYVQMKAVVHMLESEQEETEEEFLADKYKQ